MFMTMEVWELPVGEPYRDEVVVEVSGENKYVYMQMVSEGRCECPGDTAWILI